MARHMTRFMTTATALVLAAACGNTADGVKEDAENAAEKTSEMAASAADKTGDAMATAGARVDAAMETVDVKTALLADTRIDAGDINVDTNQETKVVTLGGTVPTEAMKTLAGEVATDKAPGFRVINNLTIKPAL